MWQIHWCYWSNQPSLGFMINFPQQGRKQFTHNSPVMKECSRHHQSLFSTFSTVPTQTQGSMLLECHRVFSRKEILYCEKIKCYMEHWYREHSSSMGTDLCSITQVYSTLYISSPVHKQLILLLHLIITHNWGYGEKFCTENVFFPPVSTPYNNLLASINLADIFNQCKHINYFVVSSLT